MSHNLEKSVALMCFPVVDIAFAKMAVAWKHFPVPSCKAYSIDKIRCVAKETFEEFLTNTWCSNPQCSKWLRLRCVFKTFVFEVVSWSPTILASLCVLLRVTGQSVDFQNSGVETCGCEKKRGTLTYVALVRRNEQPVVKRVREKNREGMPIDAVERKMLWSLELTNVATWRLVSKL